MPAKPGVKRTRSPVPVTDYYKQNVYFPPSNFPNLLHALTFLSNCYFQF